MATFGSVSSESTIPNSGSAFQGLNVNTQAWSNFTMPTPGGWVTKLHVYFDADVTSGNGDLVLWNHNTGTIMGTIPVNGIPVGSNSPGGQAWHNGSFATPIYVIGGTPVSIGFWMPGASGFQISSLTGGSSSWNGVGFSSPGNQTGSASTGIGTIGAFGEYTPNLISIRRSGVWQECPLQIRRSGIWVPATPLKIRRSGAWIQVQ